MARIPPYSYQMAFLRTLFWIVLTVVVVVFSVHNWVPVTINLFGGLLAEVKLPALLAIAFLAGFVPLYIYHRTIRWRDRRRPPVIVTAPAAPPPDAAAPGFGPAPAD